MAVRAVTIGFFDGVHIGHRRVLNTVLSKGGESLAITFWPHPRAVLQQDARGLCMLSSLDEKIAAIKAMGIDEVLCLDFTKDFASMSAESFIKRELVERYHCTDLVLGYDNRLGSDGLSTFQVADLARECGMNVEIVPPCELQGVQVSSTKIRQALSEGEVALAARMLGEWYSISGPVIPGNQIGRKIGFPTANIAPSFPLKAIPADGVYATRIKIGNRVFGGMTNIGVRPTVTDVPQRVIETHIFDFHEDIYGLEISVTFIDRVRGEVKFSSLEELTSQLRKDEISIKDRFAL